MPQCRRLSFESLESRQLLAVDLTVVDVLFVDPTDVFGSATGTPVEGQKIVLRADVSLSGFTGGENYKLRFDIDGVPIDIDNGLASAGQNIIHIWARDGWVARPDVLHTVTVTVDPGNAIAEMDEMNNSFTFQFTPDPPTSLPQKFINPLAGVENVDWLADGYVDVDPVLQDLGITTAFPFFRDIIELPSDNDAFPAQSLFLFPWVVFSSIEPGDTWEMKIFKPDGTEFVQPPESTPITFPADISGSWQWNRWRSISAFDPEAGNWRAEVFVNGTSVGEETFVVGRTLPELRVIEDDRNDVGDPVSDGIVQFDEPLIIDGRRTPLDFGKRCSSFTSKAK